MNAIAKTTQDDAAMITILQNSLYPGAKPDSIRLVLSWCRATGRDPMKKPVHIVPTSVKQPNGQYVYQDTLMLGIGTYRTDAARTGEYVGKSEPEFGPELTRDIDGMRVTFPQWCKVTVQRWVQNAARSYTAKEFWLENYAVGKGSKGVNDMWRRRAYGQLAKVAESQALRMAFPDETGNTNTAEEMEGKGDVGVIEGSFTENAATPEPPTTHPLVAKYDRWMAEAPDLAYVERAAAKWAKDLQMWERDGTSPPDHVKDPINATIQAALVRFEPQAEAPKPADDLATGLDDEILF